MVMNRKSKSSTTRSLPTPRDLRVLEALRQHSRLTARQIRVLFFRQNGHSATAQTVNARLRKLVDGGYLTTIVVDGGAGAGPYAYGLGPSGWDALGLAVRRVRGRPGPVHHHVAVGDFRVALDAHLRQHRGRIVEWVGEPQLRALIRSRNAPFPDALVHWRLPGREGIFYLELDRGTEPLAVLTAKLARYSVFARKHGHRDLLPGLGLRPRLAFVANAPRAERLVRFIRDRRHTTTILVGVDGQVAQDPLGRVWWRNDLDSLGSLVR
jgi:hypothetical protein